MLYTLKHKDINLAVFETLHKDITSCIINTQYLDSLPLPLKRLIKPGYDIEFIESKSEDNNYIILNEDGCILFDGWLSDREIPINRYNYDSYIQKDYSPRKWLLENNGYSFNDCYWIESEKENLTWKDIQDKFKSLDEFYTVKDNNHIYKGHNSTLGGQLEKFWYKKDQDIMLCKKIDMQYDILIAREIIASLIYRKQGYNNFCNYDFVYDKTNNIIGCICQCFTNENIEFVSAYDLLEEYNMTQLDNIWDKIVELASHYGLSKQETHNYLDIQTIVDFLISNRDRHQGNIGFLRNSETLKFISPAPIFDNGSSKTKEGEYPENLVETTVNGLYNTEFECLSHVKNFSLINIDKLPTKEEVQNIFNQCRGLTLNRKEFLLTMYEEKKSFLRELQQKRLIGQDLIQYLTDYKNTYENHKIKKYKELLKE